VAKFHIKVIIEIELIKVQLNEVQLQVRLKVQVVIQVMLILTLPHEHITVFNSTINRLFIDRKKGCYYRNITHLIFNQYFVSRSV
jgi:hypothetical protein